ncbi:MAG: VOC family protein [Chloroflexi bacterium]|nr:MAG: VOC family protein [Chloroflexota bacterium]
MIKPCIVYADRAEEAIDFYVSLFPNSKVLSIQRAEADNGPVTKGQVLGATFQLDGREYLAFDGGPTFKFTEGFSLMVTCKDQAEVDKYWNAFTANGGEEGPCGWCKDRFGLSWQVVPEVPRCSALTGAHASGDRPAQADRRAHFPRLDRRGLGAVDDERRNRIVVGSGWFQRRGARPGPPARRRAVLRDERDRPGSDRVHGAGGHASDDRAQAHVQGGRPAAPPGL